MHFEPLPLHSVIGAFLIGFPALFSIVNPVGSSLIFYEFTANRSHHERVGMARAVAINASLVLMGSLWLGSYVLNVFGVSLGALRVGGGLVVAVTAWHLLMPKESAAPENDGKDSDTMSAKGGITFFPLTMPLTTGPGTIAVAIALASERPLANEEGTISFFIGLTLAALANAILVFIAYVFADRVLLKLGDSGVRVVTQLMAFLLLCIGVQIISSGSEGLLGTWLTQLGHSPVK